MNAQEVEAYYRRKDKNPIKMARMFRDLYQEKGNQERLAQSMGIATGAISHYIGLLRLPDDIKTAVSDGKLQFKSARALATSGLSHARLKQIAGPCMDGSMSSYRVEKYVALAKKHPHLAAPALVGLLNAPQQPRRHTAEDSEVPVYSKPAAPTSPTSTEIRDEAFKLAGMLMVWKPADTIEDLLAKQALKKLRTVMV